MSQSVSSPWIRDYFVGVAETYGARLFDAPLSSGKKKVQLTDFLTYQENSYVWAWISDKDYKVSVRISKDAVDTYESNHGRNIIDRRFSVVSIANYRPMFSPRPVGPNATGNTRVSHLSLEVGLVKSVGVGAHLFGNPHDLESDESMKEWVSGLRQDGGGGNVLMLRKQQELAQNQKTSLLPSPPPFSLCAPVSQCQAIKPTRDIAEPKPDQPQDLGRVYTKRWRTVADPWKFASKPAEERSNQTEPSPFLVEPRSDATCRLESRHHGALGSPASPLRTSSPSRSQRQGTPTNWSPSNRGSPAPDKATTFAFKEDEIERHGPEASTSAPQLLPDTISEGHGPADTTNASDICSLQPPTPAQRIKHSSSPRSTPPPPSSSEVITHSSPFPSQQLPCSFPPPPSSSLPPPLSLLPVPINIQKNIRRKVPHPGLPNVQPDPAKKGSIQILVPNSDTSGAGSSQSYSQSQVFTQSRQLQRQLLSQPALLPSSLANDFEPPDTSTPREGQPGSPARRTPNMFQEPVPPHCIVDKQETALTGEKYSTEKPDTQKQEWSGLTRPLAPSAPKIEVLEVGTSDTEEEADQLQSAHTTTRTEVEFDAQTGKQNRDRGDTDVDHGMNHSSVDKAEVHSVPQSSPYRQLSSQRTDSVIQHPSSNQHEADRASAHPSPQPLEHSISRSSVHSLFSDSLGDEGTRSSQILPVGRIEVKVQEKASSSHVPSYDAEAWKEPSFLTRKRGKEKTPITEELDTPKAKISRKRRRSAEPELVPAPKRAKVAKSEGRQMTRGRTTIDRAQPQDIDVPATGKTRSSDRPSTSSADTAESMAPPAGSQSSKPRLANLVVGFERIDLGKKVPVSMVDLAKDMKGMLLRTGRIRTLGEEVERDGEAYLMQ